MVSCQDTRCKAFLASTVAHQRLAGPELNTALSGTLETFAQLVNECVSSMRQRRSAHHQSLARRLKQSLIETVDQLISDASATTAETDVLTAKIKRFQQARQTSFIFVACSLPRLLLIGCSQVISNNVGGVN